VSDRDCCRRAICAERMNADPLSVLLAAILSLNFQAQENSMNALFVIAPYFKHGTWVFTDERRNLVEEPFVAGVPEIITELVADIPNAKAGFRLTFSAGPFPGHQLVATRGEPESGGYWYHVEASNNKGWVCPALFKFFSEAPAKIYVRADPLPGA
jgi:hypothetical protein